MWPWSKNAILKEAVRLYAGEHVLRRVLALGRSGFTLCSEPMNLTIMFVELGRLREEYRPEQFVVFLNKYIQNVTDRIVEYRGVIDSYSGESMIAWWHDAKDACDCARKIVEVVSEVELAIGIHTGPVVLGNYGSSHRIKFTVLGDNVTLASRICALANTKYKTPIVITGSTKESAGSAISAEILDTVRVKGKDGEVQLYAL